MDHLVNIRWDDEAHTWYAICDTIPLALESDSFDDLIKRIKVAAPEILSENNINTDSTRLHFRAEHWEYIA